MLGMNAGRHAGQSGCVYALEPDSRVRMDDIRRELPQQTFKLKIRDNILAGQNGTTERIQNNYFVASIFSLIKQPAFRTQGGTGNQCDFVSALSEQAAGNQRVFLRTAENQSRDNVNNFQ